MKNLFLALVAIFALSSIANAQATSTASNATANATIICPINISHDVSGPQNELNFGCLTNDGSGSMATNTAYVENGATTPANAATTGSLVSFGSGPVCTATGAAFTLKGQSGYGYNVSIPDIISAGNWSVDFTYDNDAIGSDNPFMAPAGVDADAFVISGTGCATYTVHVGGTLSVDPAFYGTVNNTFAVTVAYN